MSDPIHDAIRAWVLPHRFIRCAWLIGSRARGDYREDSDADIVLDLDPNGEFGGAFILMATHGEQWTRELSGALNMPVHLFAFELGLLWEDDDREKWSPREKVAAEGVLVFSRDPTEDAKPSESR